MYSSIAACDDEAASGSLVLLAGNDVLLHLALQKPQPFSALEMRMSSTSVARVGGEYLHMRSPQESGPRHVSPSRLPTPSIVRHGDQQLTIHLRDRDERA